MKLPCLITALPAESRPFIEHFKLQSQEQNGLRLFIGNRCILLQTGLGKLSAAAATGALLQARRDISGIINIGVAGCEKPIGTQLLAHCIEDAGSEKRWYPHLPSNPALLKIDSITVKTVDQLETNYCSKMAFEMEAAGVFSAARGKLDSSAVQCLKVVSDNSSQGPCNINKEAVHHWMRGSIDTIEHIMSTFTDPTDKLNNRVSAFLLSAQSQLHLTVSQQHQLQRLATQHIALTDTAPRIKDTNAKAMLQQLKIDVAELSVKYSL